MQPCLSSEFFFCGASVLPPCLLLADALLPALGCLLLLLLAGGLMATQEADAPFRRSPDQPAANSGPPSSRKR